MKYCEACGRYVPKDHPPADSKEHRINWGWRR